MKLDQLALFLEIVERGSLAAAGRALGLSPATVSERLAALESHYGATLLQRTTRALHLTDEGRLVVEGARRVLEEAGELEARVRLGREALSGPIRMQCSGRSRSQPRCGDGRSVFSPQHPDISVELVLTDGYVDVVGEGVDLAVRFGELADSTLRLRAGSDATGACVVRCALVPRTSTASRRRTVRTSRITPCLLMRFGRHLDNVWRFRGGERVVVSAVTAPRTTADSSAAGVSTAWGSRGSRCSTSVAELMSGELVEVLSEFAAEPTPVQIVFPPHRTRPRRVEASGRGATVTSFAELPRARL